MTHQQIEIPRQAGLYVRNRREGLGLTRFQAARQAGVSERLLASLELGDAPGIRLDKLLAILNALGLSLFVASEENAVAGSDWPTTSHEQNESLAQHEKANVPAGTHASYDELYRAFVRRQGFPAPDTTGFEGRD